LFFARFGEVHPRFSTPGFAIAAQAVWAVALLLSGTYESLIDYAMFALWVFYGLTIFAVIRLRRLQPNLERPYRMWGYPATPLLFVALAIWFLGNMLVTRPEPSLAGLALIATGIPVYFFWRKSARHGSLQKRKSVLRSG
jgi:APA family basic amino acid/polyamine antiporter